jgi:transcriptional regulator of acetoin/glycerol metabolism
MRLRQRIAYELGPDAAATADIDYDFPAIAPLTSLTRDAVLDALAATRGNKSRAAARLGLERTKLYRELERHGIEDFTPADGAARMKPALTDGDD